MSAGDYNDEVEVISREDLEKLRSRKTGSSADFTEEDTTRKLRSRKTGSSADFTEEETTKKLRSRKTGSSADFADSPVKTRSRVRSTRRVSSKKSKKRDDDCFSQQETRTQIVIEGEKELAPCGHLIGIVYRKSGICEQCEYESKMRVTGPTVCHKASLTTKTTITKHMAKLPFPDDVKQHALINFNQLGLTNLREKSRVMAFCYCIYRAYIDLGIHIDINIIGMKLELSNNETLKAFSTYNSATTEGFENINGYVDPVDVVPCYAEKFGLAEDIHLEIQEYLGDILEKNPELRDEPSRTLVASYMWHYFQTVGIEIERHDFAHVFGLEFATIKSLYGKVSDKFI